MGVYGAIKVFRQNEGTMACCPRVPTIFFFYHQLTCCVSGPCPKRQVLKFSGSSAIAFSRLVSGWFLIGAGSVFSILDTKVSNHGTDSIFANYQVY